ncbi:M28 family peptidase [Sphingomonas arenae]|uniref:M28 family peptidase n=1 Tax=Sphingomonas arenae TaxID=2812555 RepID=UPI001968A059|nr:M28 family peptidase [Sphingomonas arenae]
MTRLIAAALAATFCTSAAAQSAGPGSVDLTQATKLREAALADTLAWQITEDLTTEVGPRLAGTEAEARARQWAVRRLTALGFANVRVDEFTIPTWVRGEERAAVLAPFPQPMTIAALGNSGSTPPGGIEAEVVGFPSIEALQAAPPEVVQGKIVYLTHAMPRTQDGSGYGVFGAPRRQGPTIASQKGAVGLVIRPIGTDWHRNPHTGVMRFTDGAQPIPAGALSNPDADQLERILKRAKEPVRMRLVLESRNLGPQPSGNVLADVPGRDPKAPPVVVACHLDSWDQGTGAIDDAAGCGIVAAAAKRIMDSGRPLRTIRVVWFGSEEVGLFGGLDYQKRYSKQPHHALVESDFGADRVWKVDSKLGAERKSEAQALQTILQPLGIVPGTLDQAEGSDIGPILADGHPGVSLLQDGTRYFDLHHTPDDTLDKIDKAQLQQNVAAWTAMLAVLSGGTEPVR